MNKEHKKLIHYIFILSFMAIHNFTHFFNLYNYAQ